ncbi:MAG: hypothetical protein Q8M16_05065 [Pirellulaceae bacterium]|nr:hypothetical protein [Pirellulaceae bacterium]
MSVNSKSNSKSQPDGRSGFLRMLTLSGVVVLSTLTSGCLNSWVTPGPQIAPPATKIAPTSMTGTDPSSRPKPALGDSSAAAARSGLLTPPLPKDLPQIPFSKE